MSIGKSPGEYRKGRILTSTGNGGIRVSTENVGFGRVPRR